MRNTDSETRPGRGAGPGVSSGLDRVREVAVREKDARFTALLHHITLERLWKVFTELKRDAAPGADGLTWWQYEQDLRANLEDLHGRVQSGKYRAKPVRRVLIPKPDGRMRPLGIGVAGGQDRPARCGGGAQCRVRGGFPGLLLRVPAGPRPASCAGRADGRDSGNEGELGAGRGYPRLLRSLDRSWLRSFSGTGSRMKGSCG